MLLHLLLAGAAATGSTHSYDHSSRVYTPSYKSSRVTSNCIGDRCAFYVGGYRAGSYKYEYGRVTVRDKRGRRILTISGER